MLNQSQAKVFIESIIVADDHELFVKGMLSELQKQHVSNNYYAAFNGAQVLTLMEKHNCPLVLMDYSMPILNGFKAARQIRDLYPQTKTICVSGFVEEHIVKQAFEHGMDGYVAKEEDFGTVMEAIYAVMKGEKFLSARAQQTLMNISANNKAREIEFTGGNKFYSERELQISIMLSRGKSVKEIAHDLYISANTVKTYKARAFKKEGVSTLAQFIAKFRGNR